MGLSLNLLIVFPLFLAGTALFVYLIILIIKALRKYINSSGAREEKTEIKRSLGEALKIHRQNAMMTQEFVAEAVGVSRQVVSKWESGASDPSTSNLLALAKLYGVSAEQLLFDISAGKEKR